jgi:hypothetical protein
MVGGYVHAGFALPGLPGRDSCGCPSGLGQRTQDFRALGRSLGHVGRNRAEGHDDQGVAHQNGDRLTETLVQRRLPSSQGASSKQGRSSCTSEAQ